MAEPLQKSHWEVAYPAEGLPSLYPLTTHPFVASTPPLEGPWQCAVTTPSCILTLASVAKSYPFATT